VVGNEQYYFIRQNPSVYFVRLSTAKKIFIHGNGPWVKVWKQVRQT